MMQPEERRKELAQLYRNLRSGNFNGATIERFRELVKEEIKPHVAAAMRQEQRREAAQRAAVAAGVAAGRRFMQRQRR